MDHAPTPEEAGKYSDVDEWGISKEEQKTISWAYNAKPQRPGPFRPWRFKYPTWDSARNKLIGALLDYSRVSVTVDDPGTLVKAMKAISELGEVVGVKNGMLPGAFVPPSGYRDAKILLRFPLP